MGNSLWQVEWKAEGFHRFALSLATREKASSLPFEDRDTASEAGKYNRSHYSPVNYEHISRNARSSSTRIVKIQRCLMARQAVA